jgi:hypothetical protein
MKKSEAIEAMKNGKKVTHELFTKDEWMTMDKGLIVLEDGVKRPSSEFWKYRDGDAWVNGYSLFTEKE